MPSVRVQCSHCSTACLIAAEHLGKPVRCGNCRNIFTPAAAPPASDECLPTFEDVNPQPAPQPAAGKRRTPRLDIGAATSPGRVRERNEDSFLVQHVCWANLDQRHDVALMIVADGMGGYDAGDRASEITIRAVGNNLGPLLAGGMTSKLTDSAAGALQSALTDALRDANRAVHQKAQSDRNCKGMGATAAVALIWDEAVFVAHVGDCRVYHQHAGRLTQVTRDQTLVARMVETGTLTPQEALTHPRRNEVAQAVGKQADLTPGEYRLAVAPGDWLIVACDGLHAHIELFELEAMLKSTNAAASGLANQLIDTVNRRGGSDNCTVVAVRCY